MILFSLPKYQKKLRSLLRRSKTPWQGAQRRILFTHATASPMRILFFRIGLVIFLCLIAFIVLYFERAGLKDSTKEGALSIVDLLYFTMITVATVGYGDIVPVTAQARLVDAFLIVPIRIIIWFIFLGTAYQFVFQKLIEEIRMSRLQKKLKNHIVVCGYGLCGSIAVRELLESGIDPNSIIVIDTLQEALESATSLGLVGLMGDPCREDLLQQAEVKFAKTVIIALNDDTNAVLLTLSVRSLSPTTRIIVRMKESTFQRQVIQAGANVVVASTKIGGYLLADAVKSKYIVPFVNDVLSTRGRVMFSERLAFDDEIGKMSNQLENVLVIGLESEGKTHLFYEEAPCLIKKGDILFVIQSSRLSHRID